MGEGGGTDGALDSYQGDMTIAYNRNATWSMSLFDKNISDMKWAISKIRRAT